MRKLTLIFALLLLIMQYQLLLGKNGLYDYWMARRQQQHALQTYQSFQLKNQQLLEELEALTQSLEEIEERARHELMMVKRDEMFYRLLPEKKTIQS